MAEIQARDINKFANVLHQISMHIAILTLILPSGNDCNNPPVRCNAADRRVFHDILSVCCQNVLTVKKPCGKIDSRMKANWVRDI